MLVDYHIHTTVSGDSNQTIDLICQDALNLGIKELCLTEHQDFLKSSFYYNRYDDKKVCEMIEYAKENYPELVIKKGIEIDYQKDFLLDIYDICMAYDFDYILGSVHQIGNVGVTGNEFYIDKTEDEVYTNYFQTLREMVCTNMFNCIAHFDFLKRGANTYYGKFNPEKYKDLIFDALKEIIKRNMCIEINANGYHWETLKDYYPDIKILEWFKDLGGKYITYGSDSHKIGHLGTKINYLYDVIRSLGFTEIATYNKRVVQPVSIDE